MRQGELKRKPHCPKCDATLDGWTHIDDAQPSPKDITVCLYCSSVLQYDEKMMLNLASADALADFDFIELQRVHQVVSEVRKRMNRDT